MPAGVEEIHEEAQPANSWSSTASTPWEAEVRKASLLASTWDTPTVVEPVAHTEHSQDETVPEEPPSVPASEPEPVTEPPNVLPVEDYHTLAAAPVAVKPQAVPMLRLPSPDDTQEVVAKYLDRGVSYFRAATNCGDASPWR